MATAKDIMTKDLLFLGSGESIQDAVNFFNKHNITCAPVQSPYGDILGVITELDLVKAIVHFKAQTSRFNKVVHVQHLFDSVALVSDSAHVSEVLRQIITTPTHRVFVQDYAHRIVGVISPKDLLRAMGDEKTIATTMMNEIRALTKEIEHLKHKISDLNSNLETYDSIFESGLFLVIVSNKEGNIIKTNSKLQSLLGYKAKDLINKPVEDLFSKTMRAHVKASFKTVVTEGSHQLHYSTMQKKEGGIFRVDVASVAMRNENHNIIGCFTTARVIESEALLRALHGAFNKESDQFQAHLDLLQEADANPEPTES